MLVKLKEFLLPFFFSKCIFFHSSLSCFHTRIFFYMWNFFITSLVEKKYIYYCSNYFITLRITFLFLYKIFFFNIQTIKYFTHNYDFLIARILLFSFNVDVFYLGLYFVFVFHYHFLINFMLSSYYYLIHLKIKINFRYLPKMENFA